MSEIKKAKRGRPPIYERIYEQALNLDVGQSMQTQVPKGKHPSTWRQHLAVGLKSWLRTRSLNQRFSTRAGLRVIWITREE